jgi:cation:H+ antiporter
MENLSLFSLAILFIIAGAVTWWAGIVLAKTTDTLDTRFKIGEALGGMILLGIGGSLPELAITFSAARNGHIAIIVGTLLGGLAMQTLVIAIFDLFVKGKRPLSYLAGSINMSLETAFAIILTVLALLATFIPGKYAFFNMNPLSPVIVIAWVLGLLLINKSRKVARFNKISVADAAPGRKHHERRSVENHIFYAGKKNWQVVVIFLIACVATLFAGVILEESGSALATQLGIGSGLFAATALALVSSLPELSTGLESIFIGDNQLAISDIMGGNAFMLTIFLLADLVAKKPVLSYTGKSDFLFAILGISMMAVYTISFIKKLKNRYFRLGLDSIIEIVLYILGIVVLCRMT